MEVEDKFDAVFFRRLFGTQTSMFVANIHVRRTR